MLSRLEFYGKINKDWKLNIVKRKLGVTLVFSYNTTLTIMPEKCSSILEYRKSSQGNKAELIIRVPGREDGTFYMEYLDPVVRFIDRIDDLGRLRKIINRSAPNLYEAMNKVREERKEV